MGRPFCHWFALFKEKKNASVTFAPNRREKRELLQYLGVLFSLSRAKIPEAISHEKPCMHTCTPSPLGAQKLIY